jgi:hypothetical protein
MSRNSRFYLAFVVLALVLAPYGSALPLTTAQSAHPAEQGFFAAALQWLADVVGFRVSGSAPNPRLEDPVQKGGGLPAPTGTSCIDPYGQPSPCVLVEVSKVRG